MLSLGSSSKKKHTISLSIDVADFNRSKRIVERNAGKLDSFYKEIKQQSSRYAPMKRSKEQLKRNAAHYKIRYSSYIPFSEPK